MSLRGSREPKKEEKPPLRGSREPKEERYTQGVYGRVCIPRVCKGWVYPGCKGGMVGIPGVQGRHGGYTQGVLGWYIQGVLGWVYPGCVLWWVYPGCVTSHIPGFIPSWVCKPLIYRLIPPWVYLPVYMPPSLVGRWYRRPYASHTPVSLLVSTASMPLISTFSQKGRLEEASFFLLPVSLLG